jgi:hypothetical protein
MSERQVVLPTFGASIAAKLDIIAGDMPHRKHALRNSLPDGRLVDTVLAPDTELWETAVSNDDDWIIVDQYDDYLAAEAGHKRWIASLTENPQQELTDIFDAEIKARGEA